MTETKQLLELSFTPPEKLLVTLLMSRGDSRLGGFLYTANGSPRARVSTHDDVPTSFDPRGFTLRLGRQDLASFSPDMQSGIGEKASCDMDHAFNRLRTHARNQNEGLTGFATRVVDKSIDSNELDEWVKPTRA